MVRDILRGVCARVSMSTNKVSTEACGAREFLSLQLRIVIGWEIRTLCALLITSLLGFMTRWARVAVAVSHGHLANIRQCAGKVSSQ